MGKVIGYGKLGRSMPLTLSKCGNLGGDVEMVAVVKELALRHPDDTFILVGRNSGEQPWEVGLPTNIINPWTHSGWQWKARLDEGVRKHELKGVPLTPNLQLKLAAVFDAIVGDTFENLDAMVMWIGQHGTSNTPIPKVGDPTQLTKPQDWCAWYSGFMLRGINRWRDVDPWNREEVNLNADARNLHKMRDLKWPLRYPVLGQHRSQKRIKHFRYGAGREMFGEFIDWDGNVPYANVRRRWSDGLGYIDNGETWTSDVHTTYARLEVNGLRPGTPFGDLISYDAEWTGRGHFGMFINEARSIGVRPELQRRTILRDWVIPLQPEFIHGTWSKEAITEFRRTYDSIFPAPWDQYYPKLHSVRCTFTTPSSGSGWATAKPWEAFAAGTVCFFHPAYDDQDNILGDAPQELRDWLRVKTPEELALRVDHLNTEAGHMDWVYLVELQRRHFDKALEDLTYMKMIEERIYG